MHVSLILVGLISTVSFYLYKRFLEVNHDPREPPILPSKIPLVGHVIGMVRKKANYYLELKQRCQLPICTLVVPGSKIYVVNAAKLVGSVQRQHKVLAFPPIGAKFAMRVCNSSEEANDILSINVNGDEGDWGCSMDFYKSLHLALAPGQDLDAMNRVMVQNIATSLDGLQPPNKKGTRIQLAKWLRHHITLATTNSVYGPMNPFQDPKIEDAFWDFESDLGSILINVLPSLTAAKGNRGRAAMGQAFLEYFQTQGHEKGSAVIQARYATSMKHKIPLEDIARHEVGGAIAILVNTSPAVFWALFYVFSQPEVLKDCRQEINSIMTTTKEHGGTVLRRLDITNLKSKCPTLISTFQEVLRHKSLGTSVRQVMQDTILDNKYLLKKDSTILMPNIVIHNDPQNWGPDVHDFNHKRFLKDKPPTADLLPQRTPANLTAFRGFGGGTTLCPGRHFATTEILAVMVMFCMRYDVSPVSGGPWVMPTTRCSNIAAGVLEPDTDIEVDVSCRMGFEDGEWAFGLSDSKVSLDFGLR